MEFSTQSLAIGSLGAVIFAGLAASTARVDKQMARGGYFMTLVVLGGLMFAALQARQSLYDAFASQKPAVDLGILAFAALLGYFAVLTTCHRLQNIGWSKWLAIGLGIPVVNLLLVLLLILKPGRYAPTV